MRKSTLLLLAICLCGLLAAADEIPELTPCTVSDAYLGQRVRVTGTIEFVDPGDHDFMYADLEEFPCRMGVAFDRILASTWPGGPPEFVVGASIVATGILTLGATPNRPEISHFLVELTEMPLISRGDSSLEGTGADQPPCAYGAEDLDEVSVEGTMVWFDDSKAAGIYAELLTMDGCLAILWVERDYWDTWSGEERVRMAPGHPVRVTGLLTTVLGDKTVDLADPPELLARAIAPCEASSSNVGRMLVIEGMVGFIDKSDPEGTYLEIGAEDCYLGVWIASEDLATWTADDLDLLSLGSEALAAGPLREMPGPGGAELILELAGTLFPIEPL